MLYGFCNTVKRVAISNSVVNDKYYAQLMTFKRILIPGDCMRVALVDKCYFKLMNYNDVVSLLALLYAV